MHYWSHRPNAQFHEYFSTGKYQYGKDFRLVWLISFLFSIFSYVSFILIVSMLRSNRWHFIVTKGSNYEATCSRNGISSICSRPIFNRLNLSRSRCFFFSLIIRERLGQSVVASFSIWVGNISQCRNQLSAHWREEVRSRSHAHARAYETAHALNKKIVLTELKAKSK